MINLTKEIKGQANAKCYGTYRGRASSKIFFPEELSIHKKVCARIVQRVSFPVLDFLYYFLQDDEGLVYRERFSDLEVN